MREMLERARRKLERDRQLPVGTLVRKSLRYALEVATAPIHLRAMTEVGAGARTLGRPQIENHGRMVIGKNVLLRSVPVPIELTTSDGALLEIGDDSLINYAVSIGATGSIRIGKRVRIGPYTMII